MENINTNTNSIKGYHFQRICKGVTKNNTKCKMIALIASDYCLHHSNITKEQRLSLKAQRQSLAPINKINSQRYEPKIETVRMRMNINLAAPGLLDLRQEVALLQALLQNLLDAPIIDYAKQLQVIDRIEKLVGQIKTQERADAVQKSAEQKVQLVINNLALVINELVLDKALRLAIAQRLAEVGQQELSAAPLDTEAIQEAPINTEVHSNDFINSSVQPGQEQQQAARAQSGDPAGDKEIEQDIPAPPVLAPSEVPHINSSSVTGGTSS